jgi:hypothetical protein
MGFVGDSIRKRKRGKRVAQPTAFTFRRGLPEEKRDAYKKGAVKRAEKIAKTHLV